jgi:hypothetical protein
MEKKRLTAEEERFFRTFRRDIIINLIIAAVVAIGVVLTLWCSVKNDW